MHRIYGSESKIIWAFSSFQLRYLQTLNSIAAEHNSTIIFPFPVGMLNSPMFNEDKKAIEMMTETVTA